MAKRIVEMEGQFGEALKGNEDVCQKMGDLQSAVARGAAVPTSFQNENNKSAGDYETIRTPAYAKDTGLAIQREKLEEMRGEAQSSSRSSAPLPTPTEPKSCNLFSVKRTTRAVSSGKKSRHFTMKSLRWTIVWANLASRTSESINYFRKKSRSMHCSNT